MAAESALRRSDAFEPGCAGAQDDANKDSNRVAGVWPNNVARENFSGVEETELRRLRRLRATLNS